jgi:hypothetical protein
VTALGGQSLLQGMVMVVGAPENGHVLDRGFGAILLLGLMLKATGDIPKSRWFLRFVVIATPLLASVPRIHTGSHLLGLVLLLAVVMTFGRVATTGHYPTRSVVPVALVLAGASSLRPIFAMTGGGMLAIYYGLTWLSTPGKRIAAIWGLVTVGVMTFVFLSPYMILSWKTVGTPMFPFMNGFGNPEMVFGGTKEGGWSNWAAAFRFISLPEIAVMIVGLFAIAFLRGETLRLGLAAVLAGFGMVFLSSFRMSAAGAYDVYRYTYPLIGFALFWILTRTAVAKTTRYPMAPPIATGVAIALFFFAQGTSAIQNLQMEIGAIPLQSKGFEFPVAKLKPSYKQLQEMIPPGEKIFTVVDAPYLLDFARNPIENVDSIGGASPPPGMPFGKGPDALKEYLKSLGYNYAICVDFDNAVLLYTRKLWENHPRQEWYFKEIWGKYALDFMENMDSIADWDTNARAGNVRLLRIQL